MRLLPAVVLVPVLMGAVGCGGHTGVGNGKPGQRAGAAPTTYVVTGVTDGGSARRLARGTQIRIRFDNDRLTMTAGCNTISGSYVLDRGRLTASALASTEMGCAAPLMAQDAWLAGLFDRPVQFTTGKDAAIISGDVVLALADRRVVHPDLPLARTRWVLDGVLTGDVAGSVPSPQHAWLRFEGTSVTFDLGCTGGSGSVQSDGTTMTFSDVVFEATPCPADSVVLPAFSAVLDGRTTYSITENTLQIVNGDRALTFRAVR
jgi:heat shock protein HslJ